MRYLQPREHFYEEAERDQLVLDMEHFCNGFIWDEKLYGAICQMPLYLIEQVLHTIQ